MARLIKAMPKNSALEMTKELIIEAFSRPRYSSEEYKKRAIEEFKNMAYLECLKSGGE